MTPIIIDFETYYSKEYSLSKMTTQEYILHPSFEVICISARVGWAGAPQSFTGTMAATKDWLLQFDWDNALCIAHNVLFDGAILAWAFGIHPKMMYCTMMGARPFMCPFTPRGRMSLAVLSDYAGLGVKGHEVTQALGKRRMDFSAYEMRQYQGYCNNDVALCVGLAKLQMPRLPREELMLLHLNILKFTKPQMHLNGDVLKTALAQHTLQKAAVLTRAHVADASLLRSNDKFATALKLFGVKVPLKISPKTGKAAYAFAKTDQAMKDLQEHPNEAIQLLVAARLSEKSTITESRLRRFINVRATAPWFAVPLLYYGAISGRCAGLGGLNCQNMPRGSELRRAMVPPRGYKMVVGDLAQIECRIVAALAGQGDLLTAFANGEDVYCKFASVLFNRPITKADIAERFLGKTSILGCGYGVGAERFHATAVHGGADITMTDACRAVEVYRNTYWKIPQLWKEAGSWLAFMAQGGSKNFTIGYGALKIHTNFLGMAPAIELPNGMPIFYPGLTKGADGNYTYASRYGFKEIWGGGLVENCSQSLARIIIGRVELYMAKRTFFAANQVHDELVYVIPEPRADTFALALKKVMRRPVSWMPELPIAAEVSIGDNYKDCK